MNPMEVEVPPDANIPSGGATAAQRGDGYAQLELPTQRGAIPIAPIDFQDDRLVLGFPGTVVPWRAAYPVRLREFGSDEPSVDLVHVAVIAVVPAAEGLLQLTTGEGLWDVGGRWPLAADLLQVPVEDGIRPEEAELGAEAGQADQPDPLALGPEELDHLLGGGIMSGPHFGLMAVRWPPPEPAEEEEAAADMSEEPGLEPRAHSGGEDGGGEVLPPPRPNGADPPRAGATASAEGEEAPGFVTADSHDSAAEGAGKAKAQPPIPLLGKTPIEEVPKKAARRPPAPRTPTPEREVQPKRQSTNSLMSEILDRISGMAEQQGLMQSQFLKVGERLENLERGRGVHQVATPGRNTSSAAGRGTGIGAWGSPYAGLPAPKAAGPADTPPPPPPPGLGSGRGGNPGPTPIQGTRVNGQIAPAVGGTPLFAAQAGDSTESQLVPAGMGPRAQVLAEVGQPPGSRAPRGPGGRSVSGLDLPRPPGEDETADGTELDPIRALTRALQAATRQPAEASLLGDADEGPSFSGARGAAAYAREKSRFQSNPDAAFRDLQRRVRAIRGVADNGPTGFPALLQELPFESYMTLKRTACLLLHLAQAGEQRDFELMRGLTAQGIRWIVTALECPHDPLMAWRMTFLMDPTPLTHPRRTSTNLDLNSSVLDPSQLTAVLGVARDLDLLSRRLGSPGGGGGAALAQEAGGGGDPAAKAKAKAKAKARPKGKAAPPEV